MTSLAPPGTARAVVDRLWPRPDPYLDDPAGWSRARRGAFLWSKQQEIKQSVRENRYTAVHAAHDQGKSWIAADTIGWWVDAHPADEVFVVWTAPTYPQVNAIIGRELRDAIRDAGLQRLRLNGDNHLYCDGRLVGYGRKPADHDQAAFQGIHAKYVLVVIDEACGVPKGLFDAADALVTNEHARMLAIGNPDDADSHFAKVCEPESREGRGWNVIHMDGLQSPNFTDEPVPDALRDLLLSPTWVQERRERWGEDSPIYQAKVRGLFAKGAENSIIPSTLVAAARRLEQGVDPAPDGPLGGVLAVDPARHGADMTAVVEACRGEVRIVALLAETDTSKIRQRIEDELDDRPPNWKVVLDEDGLGGPILDELRARGRNAVGFKGSERARHRPHRFANRKAEAWWGARLAFRDGLWKLPGPDEGELADDLAADLCAPKHGRDANGRILVEDKRQVRRRLGRSPDLGDGVVMAVVTPPDVNSPGAYKPPRRGRSITSGMLTEPM